MKNTQLLLILFLAGTICKAQNLVPNGGFEQYSACPSGWGQIDSALYWINPNNGTPDYFNVCSTFNNTGVPSTGMGNRPAHNGDAYGGIALYDASGINKREYIETPLTTPLVANELYHFEMFTSIGYYAQYTTDEIQVYFSDTLISNINSVSMLPYSPQLSNDSGAFIGLSPSPWTLISGDYTAHGGENFMVIGNFKNDSSTTLQIAGSVFNAAYSYIDDISLSIVTGIQSHQGSVEVNLFPNPFSDYINVSNTTNELLEISIYSIYSVNMIKLKFSNSLTINTAQLANGIYLYEVRNHNGLCKKGKIVKE